MNSMSDRDLASMLVLNRLGIRERRRAVELLREGQYPGEVLEVLNEEGTKEPFDPLKELDECRREGVALCTVLDAEYPAALKEIPDPPLLFYMKGMLETGDANAVAVVGTRHPSFYGRTQARRFSGELAAKGITIISGLARGIDQAAHEAALGVPYGRTIAVLGCGIDVVYPKENEKLSGKITERGALISEYPLGTPPLAENFPRRNRIISGLSHGVLVIEAHSRSGSLITAHEALDQGREVFALPGPVDQLTSRGTHQLIREGAALIESPEEIFEALADRWWSVAPPESFVSATAEESATGVPIQPVPVNKEEEASVVVNEETLPGEEKDEESAILLEALREESGMTVDEILEMTGLDAARVATLLFMLELGGRIRKTPDGRYFMTK
ncbi:MAG TPA: DNA-processing protein DprA [Candidatus Omnitrophota bacterium]|nr:DNA-processing protein DprA [Candidatus Omnitrophota bacterium]